MKYDDLKRVGPGKPLGYLPLGEVGDQDEARRMLEGRGLKVLVLNQMESGVYGGAMVAYDRAALAHLLKSRSQVLRRSKWPTEPDEFVMHHMRHHAPFKTELFDLIADAYDDRDNPYRRDSKAPMRVAMRHVKFGLLKACYSHLF